MNKLQFAAVMSMGSWAVSIDKHLINYNNTFFKDMIPS